MTRIPVTVIGGYLGAGKTTLVNHLLRNADGVRIAILVNDFGALPIDADLIEAQDDDLISIAGGCVCCSFGSDLMDALVKMSKRVPAPDHVVLETSGVALPGSVARSVALVPSYRIDGVVVLADAETAQSRAGDKYMGDTITRQLAEADLVIASKADLVSITQLETLRAWIGQVAPHARVIESTRGNVPSSVLFGTRSPDQVKPTTLFSSGSIKPTEDASVRYESASFPVTTRLDVDGLARALADPVCGLLRAKGVLLDTNGKLKVVHVVGPRFEVTESESQVPSGIACIGLRGQLDGTAIEKAVTANYL